MVELNFSQLLDALAVVGFSRSNANILLFLLTLVVAPDTINNHVKTCREEQKSLHFFAPEYGGKILPVYHLSQMLSWDVAVVLL